MISSHGAWRARLRLWLPALILVALNLAFLSTYRFLLAGQAQLQAGRIERRQARVEELEAERLRLEETVTGATRNRERVDRLYKEWLTPESQRLTTVIAEVKKLAQMAGVEYSSFSYPGQLLEEQGLIKRSLVFSVEGSYLELRSFINLLEVSDLFLILESMRLSGGAQEGRTVRVSMTVSTLFVQDELGQVGGEPPGASSG
jgi:type IV pilus assembly protein PilO